MLAPAATLQLARQIINSWEKEASYIVVTPPFTEALDLWSLLREPQKVFKAQELPSLATAYADPAGFSDKAGFVRIILEQWRVRPPETLTEGMLKPALWQATESVRDRGAIPLLLIPNFHEAIQKLDANIGYILREIQHSLSLRTVVALPRSYQEFLEWLKASSDTYLPFLNSEFGSGHRNVCLRGYSREELDAILASEQLPSEVADPVFKLSGGLPKLVMLLLQAAHQMDLQGLRSYAREQTRSGACRRFVEWLDKPGHDIYKRLVTERFTGIEIKHSHGALESHDWRYVLVDDEGRIRAEMIGWACADAYWRADPTGVQRLFRERLAANDARGIGNLLGSVPSELKVLPEFEAGHLVAKFVENANPFGDTWEAAKVVLEKSFRVRSKGNRLLDQLQGALDTWGPFVQTMAKYSRAKRADNALRVEKYLLQNPHGNLAMRVYLQFLALCLKEAAKLQPASARQTVLALPEGILQAYCFAKLNIAYWDAPKADDASIANVRALPWRKDYSAPPPGSIMTFEDLIGFGWVGMQELSQSEWLFDSLGDVLNLRNLYKQARGAGAHSVDVVSNSDWALYHDACKNLLRRAARCLLNTENELDLPNLLELLNSYLRAQDGR